MGVLLISRGCNVTYKCTDQVDMSLSVLCAVATRGETLTQQEIADVCGCSRANIFNIEKRALLKARTRYENIGYEAVK
jgi:transcriptional regulator